MNIVFPFSVVVDMTRAKVGINLRMRVMNFPANFNPLLFYTPACSCFRFSIKQSIAVFDFLRMLFPSFTAYFEPDLWWFSKKKNHYLVAITRTHGLQ